MPGFAVLTVFKTVFAPHPPLTSDIPAHGNFHLMYRLIQQLHITEITFLAGTRDGNFLTSSGRLPVQDGSAKKNNDQQF